MKKYAFIFLILLFASPSFAASPLTQEEFVERTHEAQASPMGEYLFLEGWEKQDPQKVLTGLLLGVPHASLENYASGALLPEGMAYVWREIDLLAALRTLYFEMDPFGSTSEMSHTEPEEVDPQPFAFRIVPEL